MGSETDEEHLVTDELEESVKSGVERLDLGDEYSDTAITVLESYPAVESPRTQDDTVAAGAVYLACLLRGDKRTQETVANEFGVSTVSVGTHYNGLIDVLKPSDLDL